MADDKIVEEVKKLLTEEEAINKATAKDFNIYRILGIESKETLICRAIAALLDDNYHNQGDCFLKLFFEQVLNREYTKKAYQIITEYYIDSGRRIDIAIKSKENETEKEFIPIEVKIFAGDQKNQCYDYCSCKENNEKKIYYLTLDGRLPSEYSVSSINPIKDREEKVIGYEGVECISFEKHILSWLSECLKCDCAIRIDNIRIMILQLQENIRALTSTGDKINSKIQKLFNCDNIDNVRKKYEYYDKLKKEKTVIVKLFDLIGNHYEISEKNISIDRRGAEKEYPYIRFKIRNEKEKENNIDFWFSVEINEETGRLWAGINCSRDKDKSWFDAVKEGYYVKYIKNEIKNDISSDEWLTRDWWLLNKTVEGSPNFYDLVEFTKWWNNEDREDLTKDNVDLLLENIDDILNQLKDLFNNEDKFHFPSIKQDIKIEKNRYNFYPNKDEAKANIKIAEAFNDCRIKFQNEWRNFIIDIIEKETNLRCIDNVKGRDGKLLSDNLYFNLYDGGYYHILYAIECKYGNNIGLIFTDNDYKQMEKSPNKIVKDKIKTDIEFLRNQVNEKIKPNIENKMYEKENDDESWWLYYQTNKILRSDDNFIENYIFKNKKEMSNNSHDKNHTLEKIIRDIKFFKEKLINPQYLSDNQNN